MALYTSELTLIISCRGTRRTHEQFPRAYFRSVEVVNGQSSLDVTLSFVIPASANKVELEVGKPGVQETARIPIALGASQPELAAGH